MVVFTLLSPGSSWTVQRGERAPWHPGLMGFLGIEAGAVVGHAPGWRGGGRGSGGVEVFAQTGQTAPRASSPERRGSSSASCLRTGGAWFWSGPGSAGVRGALPRVQRLVIGAAVPDEMDPACGGPAAERGRDAPRLDALLQLRAPAPVDLRNERRGAENLVGALGVDHAAHQPAQPAPPAGGDVVGHRGWSRSRGLDVHQHPADGFGRSLEGFVTLDRLPVLGLVGSLLAGVECLLLGVVRLLSRVERLLLLVVRDLRLQLRERLGDGHVGAHSRSLQDRSTPVLR